MKSFVQQLDELLRRHESLGVTRTKDVHLEILTTLLSILDCVTAALSTAHERPVDSMKLDSIRSRVWEMQDHLRWLRRATVFMSEAELAVHAAMTTRDVRDLITLIQMIPSDGEEASSATGAA